MDIRRAKDEEHGIPRRHLSWWLPVAAVSAALTIMVMVAGCASGGDDETTLGSNRGPTMRDLSGEVGEDIQVEDAVVSVRAFEVAFQPAMPTQRLSDETPTAPSTGESFYQAYVRVENDGDTPVRVDPEDFRCVVGSTIAVIEPTRSGPIARSLIPGTSLDLLLTFRGPAGFEPTLLYNPPWYDGAISIGTGSPSTTTSTTEP